MSQWRFIDSGTGSAAWNMAADEALLRSFAENNLPILRLYRWEKPALSFGRFSQPASTLSAEALHGGGLQYTRRMTGGGILVHGGDLSYALIVPQTLIKTRGVRESYRYFCGFLLTLYRRLGLEAAFANDTASTRGGSDVCLAGKERYDIIIGGRKIGGNAQRHTREAMLQHGTVPLSIDRAFFAPFFRKDSGLDEAFCFADARINLSPEALISAVADAFGDTFGAKLVPGTLNENESALARQLYVKKYTTEAWNVHGTDPL